MEYKLGYNKKNGAVYSHSPNSEKELFKDLINDYIKLNSHLDKISGIEIGVLNGETSGFLLSINKKIDLYGIDPIIPDSMEQSLIGNIEIISNNTKLYADRFHFIQDYSFKIHNNFTDNSFDFIFIDGDHTYDAVKNDYNLYFNKIKNGGLIFFHDSRMYRGGANFHEGSSRFCDEVISSNHLELVGEAFSLTGFIKY